MHLAKKIDSDYLKDGSTGRTVLVSSRRATNLLRRIVHPEEDFSDYTYPPNSPNSSRTLTTSSEFDSLCSPTESIESFSFGTSRSFQSEWTGYFSVSNAKNAIKVTGDPVDRVTDILQTLGLKSEIGLSCATSVHTRIFDELDEIVFGYLKDIYWDAFRKSFWWTRHHEFLFLSARKVVSTDFFTLRVLGKGGFGMVNACKRCTTGKHYAMKRLHKKGIKLKKAAAHCLQERSNLATIHSPFVVRLRFAFTTPTDLYLILDLMTGGDLGFHLSRKGRFSDREARYYAARTLLGIAAMHEKGIAHRDLKPENILMDEDGYTKISDLGLACKVSKSGLSGTCGTRGYWAPEMLRRNAQSKKEHYTLTVDWFSFGCCLYEFLYGVSPFRTEKARNWGDFMKTEKADRDRAIDLAVQYMEPEFDDHIFNAAAKDLISKLLNKDGKRRLGANGFKEIAAHPWFKSKNWSLPVCRLLHCVSAFRNLLSVPTFHILCNPPLHLFPPLQMIDSCRLGESGVFEATQCAFQQGYGLPVRKQARSLS